jgi:hypothetical protein
MNLFLNYVDDVLCLTTEEGEQIENVYIEQVDFNTNHIDISTMAGHKKVANVGSGVVQLKANMQLAKTYIQKVAERLLK